MSGLLVNIGLYQLVWFNCVVGGDRWAPLGLCLLLIHLVWSPYRRADVEMMAILLGAGLVIDGTLTAIGILRFDGPARPIPLWLVTIWLALATLVHHSLRWLKTRPLLSLLFGATGGPLAYWAGVKLNAAAFGLSTSASLLILALIWAVLWPAIMYLAQRRLPLVPAGPTPPPR